MIDLTGQDDIWRKSNTTGWQRSSNDARSWCFFSPSCSYRSGSISLDFCTGLTQNHRHMPYELVVLHCELSYLFYLTFSC
ncbi:hypothetical protein ANCCAN_23641 [Ancylostoma caninum]|uniref:Uncharacterized protein n=1 Tax=Ancylostoma caninum TaxID=29170 RepID=A0A368FI73_ANCCA|nr:hypothetical protein ANCCAN_23641 [Ancylostoma caninum]